MGKSNNFPLRSYGVITSNKCKNKLEHNSEELKINGFTILDSSFTANQIKNLRLKVNELKQIYRKKFQKFSLEKISEQHILRLPFLFDIYFMKVIFDNNLIQLLKNVILGDFQLSQCNVVINPVDENYSQGSWHRDLPYQHFVSSRPLSVNALLCLDDFTTENGATSVIPFTHQFEKYPSNEFISKNAIQVEAKAGQFIVMNSMLFHGGSKNLSNKERIGINHVFSIPHIKQQIKIKGNLPEKDLTEFEKKVLGIKYFEPSTIEEFFLERMKK